MSFHPQAMPYAHQFKTIDSHTMGEATRIIYDGFPDLPGDTMIEKKKYLEKNYDNFRKALMLEPRGHKDMFGALITKPVHPEADLGVIFMDSGGYLNMCGHGSIGMASMAVETGLVRVIEPYTEVVLDAPSGIIRTRVHVVNQKAIEVSILNVPSFLYKEGLQIGISGYGDIPVDISFGGSFFALVDAEEIGLNLIVENIDKITDLGMKLRKKINETVEIRHPYLDIDTVDLVEFYCHSDSGKADMKNCVIFGGAQADRSPCGTGTSAKLAALYAKGKLGIHEPFIYESITGSLFKGEVTKEIEIDGKKGIIPRITGSAYITGMNTWILDDEDPLEYGFLLGIQEKKEEIRLHGRIVKVAWQLFRKKGFEETSIDDIISMADVTNEDFHKEFAEKEDLLDTLGDLFDQKYAELMVEMNPHLSSYEKLMYLNKELFDIIEKQVPLNLLTYMYSKNTAQGMKNFLNENRLYYKLICQIIKDGQQQGELKDIDTPEHMAYTYAFLEREMLYDWCITGGQYCLVEKSQQLLPIYLKKFLW